MENQGNNQNNPSGIWQGIWAKLFIDSLEALKIKNYNLTFELLQQLQMLIPPECEKKVTDEFSQVEQVIYRKVTATTDFYALKNKKAQVYLEAPKALLHLIGSVRTTLYEDGWINKNFGAKPRYEKKGHLEIPTQ